MHASPRPSSLSPDSLILVADLGGTNIRMALARGTRIEPTTVRRYATADFDGLTPAIADFLATHGAPRPDAAAIAVAGAVRDGRAQITNLDWKVTLDDLKRATGTDTVVLLNDLQAQGHALAHLPARCLTQILPGATPRPWDTRLAIGLGTGFNACPVHLVQGQTVVPAAEYGQTDLPVRTREELALARALAPEMPSARVEDLLSGPGLARAYAALSGGGALAPAEVIAAVAHDPAAQQTLELFVRLLGRVCADLALAHLPFGGIFLVGGVSRAVTPFLASMGFADSFNNRGQFSEFMTNFPIHLVQDDMAALTGCARALGG